MTGTSHSETCAECGSPLPTSLDGNCVVCLLELGGGPSRQLENPGGRTRFDIGRSLGDYELLEEIARGGMGIVYRARQMSLNRQVAVKILPGGQFADETFIKRFRREAEAAASLNHPNIVAIHEVGEQDGQLYFSMELIEGRSLADAVRDEPMGARRAAGMLKMMAEAMGFAHARGVLHRDLKPSNVVLDAGETPHITDFGLAKRADGDTDLTLTGQIVGSPNYMAPEQADPKLGPTTEASDIYSLGAILYHLLTGRPPFMGSTVAQTLRLVTECEPVPPRLLHPEVPRDLQTVCLKALELDPRNRYQSAAEFAEELERFLSDEPIRARPSSSVKKLAGWCRRRPALALSFATAMTLLLIVAIGSPIALMRIRGEREVSERARREEAVLRKRSEAAERQARQQLYTALYQQAHASVRSGEVGQRVQALDAVRRAAAISNSPALRREAVAALALPDLRFERALPAGPPLTMKLIDPAFEKVAVCRGAGAVEIRSASDWRLEAKLPASTNLEAHVGRWSADGRYLAIKRDHYFTGERSEVEVWDVPGRDRVLLVHNMANNAFAFYPGTHRLMIGQVEGITTWDLDKPSQSVRLEVSGGAVRLDIAPDGERFAVATGSGDTFGVAVRDSATGVIKASTVFTDAVTDLAWQPGGEWIAISDYGGTVHLMNSRSGELRALGSHKAQAANVTFSPDGHYLLSGGWESELICWDMHTLQRSLTIGRCYTAQFRSDGKQCALITDAAIELYKFERPICREFAEDLGRRLQYATFSPGGRWLAASADQHVGVWDLTRPVPGALAQLGDEARTFFSSDEKKLFASSSDDRCSGWRLEAGTNTAAAPVLGRIELSTNYTEGSLSIASNLIAFTGANGSRIAKVENAAEDAACLPTARGVNRLSPDGQWLGIFRPYSTSLYVYRLPDVKLAKKVKAAAYISDFVFTPQGDEIAISSRKGVEFWSTENWARTRVLTNFAGVVFSRDGGTFWLRNDLRAAGLYNARTLESLLELPSGVLPLALSADGCQLAVSVNFRYLQVWDLEQVRSELKALGLDWNSPL